MLAERLKMLRGENDITQETLANDINCSRQAIGNWETNRGEPNIETLIELSNYFGVSIDYLCGKTDIRYKIYEDKELCKYLNKCIAIYDEFFKNND